MSFRLEPLLPDSNKNELGQVPLNGVVTIAVTKGIPHCKMTAIRCRNLIEHIYDSLKRKLYGMCSIILFYVLLCLIFLETAIVATPLS